MIDHKTQGMDATGETAEILFGKGEPRRVDLLDTSLTLATPQGAAPPTAVVPSDDVRNSQGPTFSEEDLRLPLPALPEPFICATDIGYALHRAPEVLRFGADCYRLAIASTQPNSALTSAPAEQKVVEIRSAVALQAAHRLGFLRAAGWMQCDYLFEDVEGETYRKDRDRDIRPMIEAPAEQFREVQPDGTTLDVDPAETPPAAGAIDAREQGVSLTKQQVYDRFSFLEGLVSEDAYRKIADTAFDIQRERQLSACNFCLAQAAEARAALASRSEAPAPMMREWCASFPGAAAGIINRLAHQIDATPRVEREGLTGWQPIDTAPKGTIVLLWSGRTGRATAADWGEYDRYNQPRYTHWMPLPDAPSQGSKGGESSNG